MNDRFKFRCYNKFQEKMFDVKSMSYIDGIIKRIEVQDEERILIFDEWQNNIDNTVIMQCTGLKDKNGKLIFEGDVVKVDKNTYADSCLLEQFENENAMITYREELGRYNIEFMPKDNSGSNVMDLMADFYYFLKWKPCGELEYGILEYIEVIGNIYENKELLEDTECQK